MSDELATGSSDVGSQRVADRDGESSLREGCGKFPPSLRRRTR